jgi:hypothetical protein
LTDAHYAGRDGGCNQKEIQEALEETTTFPIKNAKVGELAKQPIGDAKKGPRHPGAQIGQL